MSNYLDYNRVESTPFVYFSIKSTKTNKGGWFKLYWSNNSGTYGHQVHFEGNNYNTDDGYFSGKTGGCGYSKEAKALNDCLHNIVGTSPTCHYECRDLFHSLRVGGNYFEGTAAKIKKIVKAVK